MFNTRGTLMLRSARLKMVVMLAIGGIGGWLAGSGRLELQGVSAPAEAG